MASTVSNACARVGPHEISEMGARAAMEVHEKRAANTGLPAKEARARCLHVGAGPRNNRDGAGAQDT